MAALDEEETKGNDANTKQIPPSKDAICTQCFEITEANRDPEDEEDDLLVCKKQDCPKRYRVLCRGCMRTSHKRIQLILFI